jgi:hypothetical protein
MIGTLSKISCEPPNEDLLNSIRLELVVTDPDSVKELLLQNEGCDRSEYSLCALRIGLLSLKHARGQIDADAVRREGDRLLDELRKTMSGYRNQLTQDLSGSLKEYFDPNSGRFQERLDRLIKKDGELERVLERQVGADGSELANTLAAHIGQNSPLMRLLNPGESDGFISLLRESIRQVLEVQKNGMLSEFSLDNKNGALSRLISELSEENGRLRANFENRIDLVTQEFSLDRDDSALSRLVRKVENAQMTISREFSLDNDGSALSRISQLLKATTGAINDNLTLDQESSPLARLRREMMDILKRHEEQGNSLQREIMSSLASMKASREEALRSTTHGNQFEDLVSEFVNREATKMGDIPTLVADTTGEIRYCKVGDIVIELGPDCAAAGEKIVVEAKEENSCDMKKARIEIETARKNRGAAVGIFVFSKRSTPAGQEGLLRCGNDIFVIWDADDIANDVMLKAAISLAKALCVRDTKTQAEQTDDFQAIDSAITVLEAEAKRLTKMKTWSETISSNSGKIVEEIRKMSESMDRELGVLREAIAGLKRPGVESK